jgi:peroxiredoxin
MRTFRDSSLFAAVAFAIAAVGCSSEQDAPANPRFVKPASDVPGSDRYADISKIEFRDDVSTNAKIEPGLVDLILVDTSGQEKKIRDLASGKSTVLVMTRGYTDPICPYCSKYTAQLIKSYSQIAERGAEVLLVYPIKESKDAPNLDAFLKRSREILSEPDRPIPFPVLLDVELKAVNHLGIQKDLSKPATYVLDPNGEVRFAYVGNSWGDRPSIEAIVRQLDAIKK